MGRYLLRRMVHFVPVLFVVSVISFTVTLLLPGDAALAMLGESNIHDKVAYEAMRTELGLDQPIPIQYAKWLGRALQGDLGRSIRTGEPVLEGLLNRLPVTLQLTAMVMVLALSIGLPLGIVSALYPNSKSDTVTTVLAIGGAAVPDSGWGSCSSTSSRCGLELCRHRDTCPSMKGFGPMSGLCCFRHCRWVCT